MSLYKFFIFYIKNNSFHNNQYLKVPPYSFNFLDFIISDYFLFLLFLCKFKIG